MYIKKSKPNKLSSRSLLPKSQPKQWWNLSLSSRLRSSYASAINKVTVVSFSPRLIISHSHSFFSFRLFFRSNCFFFSFEPIMKNIFLYNEYVKYRLLSHFFSHIYIYIYIICIYSFHIYFIISLILQLKKSDVCHISSPFFFYHLPILSYTNIFLWQDIFSHIHIRIENTQMTGYVLQWWPFVIRFIFIMIDR